MNKLEKLAIAATELDLVGNYSKANEIDEVLAKVAASKGERKKSGKDMAYIFPPGHKNNKGTAGKFPIFDEAHGKNALSRASGLKNVPEWYSGSLQSLVSAVQRAVKKKYPGIETTDKSKKPGKG